MIGAALGISRIGTAAVESMARQPEVAGDIRGAMIVAAALIEGVTFFALIVCILMVSGECVRNGFHCFWQWCIQRYDPCIKNRNVVAVSIATVGLASFVS